MTSAQQLDDLRDNMETDGRDASVRATRLASESIALNRQIVSLAAQSNARKDSIQDLLPLANEEQSMVNRNLILNPGAERPFVGWTVPTGFATRADDPPPHSARGGDRYFFGGDNQEDVSATQVVDLRPLAGQIDNGAVSCEVGGLIGAFDSNDKAELTFTFRDGGGVFVQGVSAGVPTERGWLEYSKELTLQTGVRDVLITMKAIHESGDHNDGYFDDITLVCQVAS